MTWTNRKINITRHDQSNLMNKKIAILSFFVISIIVNQSCAQKVPELIANRINYCDSNYSDELTPSLIIELDELENYFVQNGLLENNSANSYYSVYKKIARDDNFNFTLDLSFPLLDSIGFNILSKCFFKLLSNDELDKITIRHFEASKKIYAPFNGSVSPGKIAQRIVDNLTEDDFELQYYKLSSLITFHKMSNPPGNNLFATTPTYSDNIEEWLSIELNEQNQLKVSGVTKSIEDIVNLVSEFLQGDLTKKAIKITSLNGAKYNAFIELIDVVKSHYNKIRDNEAKREFGKIFSELSEMEAQKIKKLVPLNIIVIEP